jgi:allantoin racemase
MKLSICGSFTLMQRLIAVSTAGADFGRSRLDTLLANGQCFHERREPGVDLKLGATGVPENSAASELRGSRAPLHGQGHTDICRDRRSSLMRIKVINPNTTASMTAKIRAAAVAAAAPGTEVVACHPTRGPVSIESHYDEAVSAIGVLDEIHRGEAEGCDGYVIACFGDPGLLAARELARGPVVGIAEAAMHVASLVATGFSIVTTLQRSCIMAAHLAQAYGMSAFCRKIRAVDLAVLDLEDPRSESTARITEECARAVEQDGCGAIVLGCAGMADLAGHISRQLRVPVVEGVSAGVKLIEALVGLGLRTSKHGDLDFPPAKPYAGDLSGLAPKPRHTER